MDPKLALVKCITLLYRESELEQAANSTDLCQKIIEVADAQTINLVVNRIIGNVVDISLNLHGTRAIQTLVDIFSFKNRKPNNAVMKGIPARHNNVIATVVLVIDQINVIIAVPRPIPPSNPENPILK